jgi:uncharacterized membrane protein YdbT with pleckstrin-like domain
MTEVEITKFTFSNRYYLTGPLRFIAGIFMVWWPNTRHYVLTNQRIKIRIGVLSRRTDEIELYRVKDVLYTASFFERVWSIGNIQIKSSQVTDQDVTIRSIKNAEQLRETIRQAVQDSRRQFGVREIDAFRDPPGFDDISLINRV